VVLDVPEAERQGLVKIREELTEEIDYVPSRFIRRHYIRPVYAGADKQTAPVVASLPARVIPQARSWCRIAGPPDRVPLYRSSSLLPSGTDLRPVRVDLSRQKLGRWPSTAPCYCKVCNGSCRKRSCKAGTARPTKPL